MPHLYTPEQFLRIIQISTGRHECLSGIESEPQTRPVCCIPSCIPSIIVLYSRYPETTISPPVCDRILCLSKRGTGRHFFCFPSWFPPSPFNMFSLLARYYQSLVFARGVWCAVALLGRPGNDPVELILRARTEAPRRAGIGQRLGPFLCSLSLRARASTAVAALDFVIAVFPFRACFICL